MAFSNHHQGHHQRIIRGPQRSRWKQKHPPCCPPETKLAVLGLSLTVVSVVVLLLGRPYNGGYLLSGITTSTSHHHHRRHDYVQHIHHPELRGFSTTSSSHEDVLSSRDAASSFSSSSFRTQAPVADAIVVGSGLAGMAAALHLLDRGGRVLLVEKEPTLGGNSNKASSGMNACCLPHDVAVTNDTLDSFRHDTIVSARGEVGNNKNDDAANLDLIDTLVSNSATAVTWLQQRTHVDLSQLVQLGGHSHQRTHRPKAGFVGAEIISSLTIALEAYMHQQEEQEQNEPQLQLLVNTQVTRILKDENAMDGQVLGVECETGNNKSGNGDEDSSKPIIQFIRSNHVVLATGGFASDRSHGSYLEQYRPELLHMPATAGPFSTGDGIALATALGAGVRDMDKIQLHPTGWVDPMDPNNPNKVLAAELLRGVGGILLNHQGKRFCNELGTRAYIADQMLRFDNAHYQTTRQWRATDPIPTFYLVLSEAAAREGQNHVTLYSHKGLMKTIVGIDVLAEYTNTPRETLISTLTEYQEAAKEGTDEFGKTVFRNVPQQNKDNLFFATEIFHVGQVIPVLHYCMGGIAIDTEGHVLHEETGELIAGLYAAGEVTGGVHGNNRLGGNSLLECAVFGTRIGQSIPIVVGKEQEQHHHQQLQAAVVLGESTRNKQADYQLSNNIVHDLPMITRDELAQHNVPEDCWVAVHGIVYDLTSFAPSHPGKAQPILNFAGKDATRVFDAVHSLNMLTRMQKHAVGTCTIDENPSDTAAAVMVPHSVPLQELKMHDTEDDAWVALHGTVYDLTAFSKIHPGGSYLITKFAGTDATETFQAFHPPDKLKLIEHSAMIGPLLKDDMRGESDSII